MSSQQSQIDRLHRRIRMLLAPAVIKTTDDTGTLLKGQININGTPEVIDPIGIMYAYGFHANPLPNTDATALFLAGDRSNPIIVATNHQQSRPRNYKPGEIGIYTDEGDTVTLNRENKLNITSKDRVTVKGTNKVALDTPLTEISKDVKAHGKIDASEGFFKNGVAIGGGSAGPPGPQGPQGPQGPPGPTGSGSYQAGYGIAINTGTAPPTISTAVPYLPLSGGTISGPLTIQNDQGSGYGGQWAMYNAAAGATNAAKYFRLSPTGTLEIINSAFSAVAFQFTDSGDFNAAGRIYANATIFNLNSSASTGAFHMAPNGSGIAYGSFWYNDGTSTYLLLTNNNDALGTYNGLRPFYVANATGQVIMEHGLNLGGVLLLVGLGFASQDAIYHHLRDKSGRAAILMGGTADNENYYWNTAHRFQGVNGAAYDYTIDASGITLQNGIAFNGRQTDNTVVPLAFVGTDNTLRIGTQGGMTCYIGTGGNAFGPDGNLYAGSHIILKNNFGLYATNAAGTGNYELIGFASDNRIKINPSAFGVDAYGPWTFTGSLGAPDITALGSGAIFVFADRAAAATGPWGLYANGGVARLWCSGTGDRVTVDSAGNVVIAGTYLYGYGGGGSVNAAGGPFIYFDSAYIIAHCGSGNAGFRVQNKDGTYVGGFDATGWVLGVNNNRIAGRDGSFTQIQDAAGNTAIYLGGTADATNYYRNTGHRFSGIGGSSATQLTVDGSLTSQGANAAYFFADRASGVTWGVYASGDWLRFYNSAHGDIAIIDSIGQFFLLAGNGVFGAASDGQRRMLMRSNDTCFINDQGTAHCNIYAYTGYNINLYGGALLADMPAYKPGGGVWLDSSDVRLKKDVEDYTTSLDAIVKLRPRSFEFNGLAETVTGHRYIGLVADEVEDIMPEMVGSWLRKMRPDDDEAVPVKTLDCTAITFALVNAVQELAKRLAAVEGRA